ncbi:MAG: HAD family hydrolase [Actinomycetota bacterium]
MANKKTVALDMIGTTFSLDRLGRELSERGAPAEALSLLFAQTLRDYFASSYAKSYVTLRDVLRSSLHRLFISHDIPVSDGETDAVLAALTELDPTPGAGEALQLFDEAGVKVIALTNGGTSLMETLLERAGFTNLVDRIVSCDDLGISKPHPGVYEAARAVSVGELWMVASHAWDIMGAAHAGLRTAWISAFEKDYPSIFPTPDVVAPDLEAAARAIIDDLSS